MNNTERAKEREGERKDVRLKAEMIFCFVRVCIRCRREPGGGQKKNEEKEKKIMTSNGC